MFSMFLHATVHLGVNAEKKKDQNLRSLAQKLPVRCTCKVFQRKRTLRVGLKGGTHPEDLCCLDALLETLTVLRKDQFNKFTSLSY